MQNQLTWVPSNNQARPEVAAAAMLTTRIYAVMLGTALGLLSSLPASAAPESAKAQVWATELAFARSMKERNFQAFGDFISGEAVFFAGTTALHGKSKVIEEWSLFFAGPDAPFSWSRIKSKSWSRARLPSVRARSATRRGKSSPGSIRSGASRLRTAGGSCSTKAALRAPARRDGLLAYACHREFECQGQSGK